MFPNTTRSRFDRGAVRFLAVVLAVVLSSLAGAAVLTVAGADAPDRPTVDVAGDRVTDGEKTTVAVNLSAAPEGLSGYKLRLSVADADVARIESVAYPDRFGLTTEPKYDGERTVTLEAADLDGKIDAGAKNVTLARVTLAGVSPGAANVTVEPVQFDTDGGSRIDPSVDRGVLTVQQAGSPAGQSTTAATGDAGVPPENGTTATTGGNVTSGNGALPTGVVLPTAIVGALGILALARRRETS